jgi:hypothetical protein
MPDGIRSPNCSTCITRSRLHVHFPEVAEAAHLAIGDRIHRASTRKGQIGQAGALLQRADEIEECLLIHRLDRARQVAVPVLERIRGLTSGTQELLQCRREQICDLGRTVSPLEFDTPPVVAKISEIELKTAGNVELNQPAHVLQQGGLAIWSQSHHFVFVAVVGKPKKLCKGLIEDAEGVRKEHSALDYQVLAKTNAPCGAGKISKPVQ